MRPRDYIHKFCARPEDDLREFLRFPMRFAGSLYASNSHILICTEDDQTVQAGHSMELLKGVDLIIKAMERAAPGIPLKCEMPDKLDGDEEYRDWQTVQIENSWFRASYIQWIRELPDVEICVDPNRPLAIAFFHFRGGWGALMPCEPPHSELLAKEQASCAA